MSIRIPDLAIGDDLKGLPARLAGLRLSQLGAAGLRLADLETPVMTIDPRRVGHNERRMLDWARSHRVLLAPHGKTTMAPALWDSVLAAGAHAITFATPWQVRAGLAAGVPRVMLANNLVDPVAIASVVAAMADHPQARLWVWADSPQAVGLLAAGLAAAGATEPLDVLVDLGVPGGRTGARSMAAALEVADLIGAQPLLQLRGVAGYEGVLGHDRSTETVGAIRAFLDRLAELFSRLHDQHSFQGRPILSAGGSAYPDLVVEHLGRFADTADVVLRSGAFQVHDSGLYERVSPFRSGADDVPLQAAIHVWARVIGSPEPGLVLLDAGKRDLPVDVDLPVVEAVLGRPELTTPQVVVTGVNDQHAFVEGPATAALRVGDVVRLGLSHPCTAFDKWRAIVEISDATDQDPVVTGAISTLF
ncbi:MAG: amino acid deaminase [Beutenbergiaceae bacterium]